MEFIIQKAVELGISEIVPVAMRNCVVKLDEKKAAAKKRRWQAIAESAAKQSKRSRIPVICDVMDFEEALTYGETLDLRLVPYENQRGMEHTREILGGLRREGSIGIFIGPEGGFDPKEIQAVQGKGELLSLGNRILRTETAGLVILSMLLYHLEE
jgi:16S rRNA (uracil1498-N3)-methyltransferase